MRSKTTIKIRWINLVFILLILAMTATFNFLAGQNTPYKYNIPKKFSDGWQVASLESEGINTKDIERLTTLMVTNQDYGYIRSLIIVKNQSLVHEIYSPYHQRNTLHWLASITKTFTSTLVGIAIDKGFIPGINSRVSDLLPKYKTWIRDRGFSEIRLEHLLSMTSGLNWNERSSYNAEQNSEHIMVDQENWIKYVVSQKTVAKPGTVFNYNTGGMHLVSAIIKSRTGMNANEFAEKYLLHPLGIFGYQWNRDPKGFPCTGGTDGGIGLKTRDLAKFGLLVLNLGVWHGDQVISSSWLKQAVKNHKPKSSGWGAYGYNWFSGTKRVNGRSFKYIASFGYGGQFLYIFPNPGVIVAITSDLTSRNRVANSFTEQLIKIVLAKK